MEKDAASGQFRPVEVPGSARVLEADMVLLAMGFTGPEERLATSLGINTDERSNFKVRSGRARVCGGEGVAMGIPQMKAGHHRGARAGGGPPLAQLLISRPSLFLALPRRQRSASSPRPSPACSLPATAAAASRWWYGPSARAATLRRPWIAT